MSHPEDFTTRANWYALQSRHLERIRRSLRAARLEGLPHTRLLRLLTEEGNRLPPWMEEVN